MEKVTPMIAQYHRIKQEQPEAILLFRVGDFYETFFEDAVLTSKVLGIVLTSRNHGKGNDVPLAGIPHHALERYVTRLIKAGHKVAICDQVEDPKLAKGIVRREVTEVITPGTVMRSSLLDEKRENLLATVNCHQDRCGLALCDLSAGNLRGPEMSLAELSDELLRNQPSEILVSGSDRPKIGPALAGFTLTDREDHHFEQGSALKKLLGHFKTASLAGFGCQDLTLAVGAAGAAIGYLEENQKTAISHLAKMVPYSLQGQMLLDNATIRNLNLFPEGHPQGISLLNTIDHTVTAMGGRLIRRWLAAPLLDLNEITLRQDAVQSLLEGRAARDELGRHLGKVQDLERLLGRIACQRAGPRDLLALGQSLAEIPQIKTGLPPGRYWKDLSAVLHDFGGLTDLLAKALADDPPLSLSKGGVIRDGFNGDLDELRSLARDSKSWIADYQNSERERTGIQSLKVKYNSVFGYHIEISKTNLALAPDDYIRKQTLSNAERFVTPELKAYEDKVLGAEEKIKALEMEIFAGLHQEISSWCQRIKQTAESVAAIDVICGLALAAINNRYVRPVVDESPRIHIIHGRHPVVERNFQLGQFVANDALLNDSDHRLIILTGPNMAGKSTYLRQIALVTIMAQMGSFVPAKEAHIGITDRVFTRIGASDDLAKGISTFMAEMNETGNILNNATVRSLVLLDEIGRGTSTFDGLAIAWAVSEYLHDQIGCRTLFATHYHELTELAAQLPGVQNYSMAVKEWGDEIIFLRQVVKGSAGQSYGVQVARLAGIPAQVISRAREILENLEQDALLSDSTPRLARHGQIRQEEDRLELFSREEQELLREIKHLQPETMTPIEALNRLAKLKEMSGEE
ncbi:MAG TPA: DNA mismatch repair protein MutS [Candidatus Edwardsbacteria bacterium]|nr:DNA mismatch repair protein MutS [Candidatus Edwardsbacteria bacterium]